MNWRVALSAIALCVSCGDSDDPCNANGGYAIQTRCPTPSGGSDGVSRFLVVESGGRFAGIKWTAADKGAGRPFVGEVDEKACKATLRTRGWEVLGDKAEILMLDLSKEGEVKGTWKTVQTDDWPLSECTIEGKRQ